MEKQTVFIKRYPSKGELPKCKGQSYRVYVITNNGIVYYDKYDGWEHGIEWWLEEIELPSEEFFIKEVERLTNHSLNKDWRETISLGYLTCASFILNKLKGETK